MRPILLFLAVGLTLLPLQAQDPSPRPAPDAPYRPVVNLGGPATIRDDGPNAFGFPAKTLSRTERRRFVVGNALFKTNWVAAPASTAGRDGLGPFFDARSCSTCHFRDGRGSPRMPGSDEGAGLLLRIGRAQEHGPDLPHPIYGGQFQAHAIHGVAREGDYEITYERVSGHYDDGSAYELQRPVVRITKTNHGPLGAHTLGARLAPQVIGLGLLEAIAEETLIDLADPLDTDGDGISGVVHRITRKDGSVAIGRFGWKATQPTVREQTAGAFHGDMGLTTSLNPQEAVTAHEAARFQVLSGGTPEISDRQLDRVTWYGQVLAVPARRHADDPRGQHGERLFTSIGCAACHVPTLQTGPNAPHPSFAAVTIHPFTNLLLHDMGPDLADEKTDGDAGPREWRTPPLWGIGLLETVNGHSRLLHDGRARNAEEAILWHGGEALDARNRFKALSRKDREALLFFLSCL